MNRLAHEIKLRIIEELLHDETSSEATKRDCLKALRRSCQAWLEIILPYLFSQLKVGLWGPSGLRRLHSISRTPNIAYYVEDVVFTITFNIANPHPAPFTRSNQRRASAGFWQQQDEPSESRFKKLLATPLKNARRKSSIAKGISKLSISSPSLSLEDLFTLFDASARSTIANNLGREQYAATVGLPSLLTQVAAALCNMFSSLPRLRSLRLDTQSQTDFINSFTHGHALQFSPVFGTFSSISDLITTTILRAWVCSASKVESLSTLAGSPLALCRFFQDFNPKGASAGSAVDRAEGLLDLSALKAKLSQLRSLSVLYDEGFHHPQDTEINLRIGRRSIDWTLSLAELLTMTPNLKSLQIGRKQPTYMGVPPVLFRLDSTTLTGSQNADTVKPFDFKLEDLSIGGFSITYKALTSLLAAFNGTDNFAPSDSGTLQRLSLGGMRVSPNDHPSDTLLPTRNRPAIWRRIFIDLRTNLNLTHFTLSEGDFQERSGTWYCRDKISPSASPLDRPPTAPPSAPSNPDHRIAPGPLRKSLYSWIERRRGYLFQPDEDLEKDEAWKLLDDWGLYWRSSDGDAVVG